MPSSFYLMLFISVRPRVTAVFPPSQIMTNMVKTKKRSTALPQQNANEPLQRPTTPNLQRNVGAA